MKRVICLSLLCFFLAGCGDEPQAAAPDTPYNPEPQTPRIELVVEASEASITANGIPRDATDILRDILKDESALPLEGFTIQIDETFVRAGQLLLVIEPGSEAGDATEDALEAAAAATFDQLKTSFQSQAESAIRDELGKQKGVASQARSEVQALQKALQFYQEAQRAAPETDASRLERRKHKLAIDNALAEQIEAEKQIESLQRQIDRGQFATLVRVR